MRSPLIPEGAEVELPRITSVEFDGDGAKRRNRADNRISTCGAPPIPHEDIDALTASFSRQINFSKQTWSRMLVEKYLKNFKWYNPQRDDENAPSLSKAWAYYEHVTLARHFVGDHNYERAQPGETHSTELYSPWKTPEAALNEWGIGVGLYFFALRTMAFILFFAGLISLANIRYYASSDYSGYGGQDQLDLTLKGSAVCTKREWAVCIDCNVDDWSSEEDKDRFAISSQAEDRNGNPVTFVLRTLCQGAELTQGMVNLGSLLFLIVSMTLLGLYQRLREVRFDEDKTTSTDYTLVVNNPPPDAFDPEEWRAFFDQFSNDGQVTFCTIALNNDRLLRALIRRRIFRNRLRIQLPKGVDLDDEDAVRQAVDQVMRERESERKSCFDLIWGCTVVPFLRLLFNRALPLDVLANKIFDATEEAKQLQKEQYKVTKVFITFESEAGQRLALTTLDASRLDIWYQRTHKVAPSNLFRGRMLKVAEPTEPDTVRWMDLDVHTIQKLKQRAVNFFITLLLIAFSGFMVRRVRARHDPYRAAILISVFNTVIPPVVKLVMCFEHHATEGGRQKALYIKVALFRWTNTAILTELITPFTSTLSDGTKALLPTIDAILIAELLVTPLLRYLDLYGFLRKHFWAPRARNQEEMNLSFTGTTLNLAERYTDFSKVLFICFFYSALYPVGFFICALILLVQYYTDKFCLMRIWGWAPSIGTRLSSFSQKYFFWGALVAFAIVSSYFWASFPFDNVCSVGYGADNDLIGSQEVVFQNGTVSEINVAQEEAVKFCMQSLLARDNFRFPAVPGLEKDEWMTDSQETLTIIYGWTSLAILLSFVYVVFGGAIMHGILSLFHKMYTPDGLDQRIDFSCVQDIQAYVPQVKVGDFAFPLLACDVDHIDQSLIGWNDPYRSYDYHNLIFDIPYQGMKRTEIIHGNTRGKRHISMFPGYNPEPVKDETLDTSEDQGVPRTMPETPIYSIVKHWPPEWVKRSEQQLDG